MRPPDEAAPLHSVLHSKADVLLETGDVILSFPRSVRLKHILNCRAQALLRGSLRSSPYSHAALVTDPFHVIDAVPDATLGMRPLADWLAHIDPARTMVLRLPPRIDARKRRVLRARMLRFYGSPYNPKFLSWLPISARPRRFFCSEFVTAVYGRCLPPTVRARVQFPIDLVAVFEDAGFTAIPLATLAATAPEAPFVKDGADLFARLGPLTGSAMDSMYSGTLAIAQARAAAFVSIAVGVANSSMFVALNMPGTGALSLAEVVDHYRDLDDSPKTIADQPAFEGVAAHAVSPRRRDDLLVRAIDLALAEGPRLGAMIQGLVDMRDAVGPFDPAAPDLAVLRKLGEALLAYWRDSGEAASAFIGSVPDETLTGLERSVRRGRPEGDDRLGALHGVLVAMMPVLAILRFAIAPWGDAVRAQPLARDPQAPPPREEVERMCDLYLWIAEDRAPELDIAQTALAGALQRLAIQSAWRDPANP